MMTRKFRRNLLRLFRMGIADREDHLENRMGLAMRILELEEGGRVAVISGGMDCDCSSWDGRVNILPATVTHVNHFVEMLYDGAEGPVRWRLARPSDTVDIRETHRDLALEAFEDGHPHYVVY